MRINYDRFRKFLHFGVLAIKNSDKTTTSCRKGFSGLFFHYLPHCNCLG